VVDEVPTTQHAEKQHAGEPGAGATAAPASAQSLLAVEDLHVEFRLRRGVVNAVAGLSYSIETGETLAIVGESGSGKSVSAHAVLGVLTTPPAYVTNGSVRLRGQELLTLSDAERRLLRGNTIATVAQNSSLNPVFSVGWQVAEPFRIHRGASRREALQHAAELMDRVGIPSAHRRVRDYPHQFSGGMRQRISIAMAMALEPEILIADEPTTALDVTVQAQIMALLKEMQDQTGMALILITHDLGLVSEVADRVVVMYAGRECETGPIEDIFMRPGHPYTAGLMQSIPEVTSKQHRLRPIPGSPPDLMNVPAGCPFHPRCGIADDACTTGPTVLRSIGPARASSCRRTQEMVGGPRDC
jgi:oligopeptide transport system ATP-binding protein